MTQRVQTAKAKAARSKLSADTHGKDTAPASPRVVKRPKLADMETLKESIRQQRRDSQLNTLDAIARVSNLENMADDEGPDQPLMRQEIRVVAQAWAKATGKPLSTHQLLSDSLGAVSEAPAGGQATVWSESERRALQKMGEASPAVQRGQLAALALIEKSGLLQATQDAVADALRCLLVPGKKPRTPQAKKLHRALKRRLKQRQSDYEVQLKSLRARFVILGEEGLIKPALENESNGRQRLATLRKSGQQTAVINHLRQLAQEPGSFGDFERFRDTLEKLDSLDEEIQQCISDAPEEGRAISEFLVVRLCERLPADVVQSLAKSQAKPKPKMQARQTNEILRRSITQADALVANLKTDAELFEALQILWGEPPLFCLRFAGHLRELLVLRDAPDFMLEVETALVKRLGAKLKGYRQQRMGAEPEEVGHEDDTGKTRVQLVLDNVNRILTPPKGKSKTKTQKNMAKKGYAVAPASRPYQDIRDWLEGKRLEAVKQEKQARAKTATAPTPQPIPAPAVVVESVPNLARVPKSEAAPVVITESQLVPAIVPAGKPALAPDAEAQASLQPGGKRKLLKRRQRQVAAAEPAPRVDTSGAR